ncbi:MAG: hypothetical protein DME22_04920 [Verrucomicrobia bacterium]|nr:MAG: hypothetical protein DME22_04920 [Verrucomicrobiota bacterium]PYJ96497.1 MAG: hypothetical protein DME23_20345 [Verrucomicrobiota bacterium]
MECWDADTLRPLDGIRAGRGAEPGALSFDGRILATISPGGLVKLWDLVSRTQLKEFRFPVGWLDSLAFSPGGKTLVGGDIDGKHFWNVASGNVIATLPAHVSACRSVSFSPDGRCLATAEVVDTIKLWPAPSFDEIKRPSPAAEKR